MKTKIIENTEKPQDEQIAWMKNTLHCQGLDAHNRSIELICELIEELDAKIDIGGESRRYDAESFAIRLRGSSGVYYRISVHYRARFARLVAQRYSEIDWDDEGAIGALMYPFKSMLDFEIHWYDARDGDWESICIHGRRNESPNCWPADFLVSTMATLADDLRQSLELEMNTLRRELRESYPVAWCSGQTSPEITFADVTKHVSILEEMQNVDSKEEFFEIQERVLLHPFMLEE